MAVIYPNSTGDLDDATLNMFGDADDSFVDLRNYTTASGFSATVGAGNVGHAATNGLAFKANYRLIFHFDLSGQDAGTIASATVQFYSNADLPSGFFTRIAQTDEYIHLAKAQAGVSFTTADVNAMTGWVSSGTYDGNVTEYATKISQQGSGGWNTFTLNATALSDINSAIGTSGVQMMLLASQDFVGANYDDPYLSGFLGVHGMWFWMMEATNSSIRPRMTTTYAVPVSDSATFFGTNF